MSGYITNDKLMINNEATCNKGAGSQLQKPYLNWACYKLYIKHYPALKWKKINY